MVPIASEASFRAVIFSEAKFAVVPTRPIAAEAESAVDMPRSALARISAASPVAACAVARI